MSSQRIKEIAGELETLAANLETTTTLMIGADDLGVSAAKCAGLVSMIQEQMQKQVNQLYSCQGESSEQNKILSAK